LQSCLAAIEKATESGLYAAGFLSYELGYLLEPRLAPLLPDERNQPLLWMGLFEKPRILTSSQVRQWLHDQGQGKFDLRDLRLSISEADYQRAFEKVKDFLRAGDVYQINLTFKYLFNFSGDPLVLYEALRRKQRVAHGALVAAPNFHVLSLSPELFVHTEKGNARVRPMKGTAPRGVTSSEDQRLREWLQGDEKSRAENLMIVDMLRNDLGRVAMPGSVKVSDLFAVETYRTVLQMTSTVTARLPEEIGFKRLIQSLFPCGSITGAPKIRAMEIIRELETSPRGVYTGAIGMVAPKNCVRFNVAIRTLHLNAEGRGEMGIGSGLVYDSRAEAELKECLLKAEFLTAPHQDFQLIETLRWQAPQGYYLLGLHLERLAVSAVHFGFPYDPSRVRLALKAEARKFRVGTYRVRLLLGDDGEITVTSSPVTLPTRETLMGFVISERRVDSTDIFLYHKTTNRELYTNEYQRLQLLTGCDEVLFLNERDEITEGSRTNIFIQKNGRLLTPARNAGLLNGTLRSRLLADRRRKVARAVLTLEDLQSAERVFLGNSVIGLVSAYPLDVTPRNRMAG
jgi:para-aminobenzoate synthetase/4-amino-4-deoxychorismate lyase